MPPTRSEVLRVFLGGERSDAQARLLEATWRERGRRAKRFLSFLFQKVGDDAVTLKAAALSFVTVLSLVPLLAAFTTVGARVLVRYQQRVLEVLAGSLPYTETEILTSIDNFVSQAENLQQIGTLVFILVGIGAFLTIEETINEIWEVSDKRSLRSKLLSFTLVLFWGPLVLGSSLSFFLLVRQRPGLEILFQEALLIKVLPWIVGTLALTMLYWQVPNTSVHFPAALAGGATAALLLDLLRYTFGIYVESLTNINVVIYGSFALAIFFMVSVQLAWWAVLLGCEVAYVTQYFPGLVRTERLDGRFRAGWIGLAGLVELARGLREGEPILAPDILSRRLGVTGLAIRDAFELLEESEIVHRGTREDEENGYLLARDPHDLRVRDLFAVYDRPVQDFLERQEASPKLRGLSRELRERWKETLADRTLAQLAEG